MFPDLNNQNQVAASVLVDPVEFRHMAVRFESDGSFVALSLGEDGVSATTLAINDLGHVLGKIQMADFSNRMVIWTSANVFRELEIPETNGTVLPQDVNNKGEVVGHIFNFNGVNKPIFWDSEGKVQTLPFPVAGAEANALNDSSQIVGKAYYEEGNSAAVRWDPLLQTSARNIDGFKDPFDLGPSDLQNGEAFFITNAGVAGGSYELNNEIHGFLHDDLSNFIDLGPGEPTNMNCRGDVSRFAEGMFGLQPVVNISGTQVSISSLTDPPLVYAGDVNDGLSLLGSDQEGVDYLLFANYASTIIPGSMSPSGPNIYSTFADANAIPSQVYSEEPSLFNQEIFVDSGSDPTVWALTENFSQVNVRPFSCGKKVTIEVPGLVLPDGVSLSLGSTVKIVLIGPGNVDGLVEFSGIDSDPGGLDFIASGTAVDPNQIIIGSNANFENAGIINIHGNGHIEINVNADQSKPVHSFSTFEIGPDTPCVNFMLDDPGISTSLAFEGIEMNAGSLEFSGFDNVLMGSSSVQGTSFTVENQFTFDGVELDFSGIFEVGKLAVRGVISSLPNSSSVLEIQDFGFDNSLDLTDIENVVRIADEASFVDGTSCRLVQSAPTDLSEVINFPCRDIVSIQPVSDLPEAEQLCFKDCNVEAVGELIRRKILDFVESEVEEFTAEDVHFVLFFERVFAQDVPSNRRSAQQLTANLRVMARSLENVDDPSRFRIFQFDCEGNLIGMAGSPVPYSDEAPTSAMFTGFIDSTLIISHTDVQFDTCNIFVVASGVITTPVHEYSGEEQGFLLETNYPNPFQSDTEIRFQLPKSSIVRLSIYNSLGQMVKPLIDATLPVGEHHAKWDGREATGKDAPAGVYYCQIEFRDPLYTNSQYIQGQKMVLIR